MIDHFVMKGDRMIAAPDMSMEANERLAAVPMPGSDAYDAALLARSKLEADAFTGIYDRYFWVIHRYIAGRLGSQAADDLAAEAFWWPSASATGLTQRAVPCGPGYSA